MNRPFDSIGSDPALGQGFTAERRRKPAAFWRPAWLAAGLLLTSGAAAGAAAAAQPDIHSRMLALINAARAEAGAGPLAMDPRLSAAACVQARDLADGGPLSHRSRDGSDLADRVTRAGYRFAMAAENLAAGAPTPDETVWLWLSSPDHRRNMLTAGFNQAGTAYVPGDGRAIWVLVLATPRTGTPAMTYEPSSRTRNRGQPVESRGGSPPAPGRGGHPDDPAGDKRLTCY